MKTWLAGALLLLSALAPAAGPAPQIPPPPPGMFAPPGRGIEHVTGDLYRARNGGWYVAFLVTRDGILLVDTQIGRAHV